MSDNRKELKCAWVAELKGFLTDEFPDFTPIPGRLKAVKEEMERGDCMHPVKVVCQSMTGKCRIEDGRHRIIAAEELGRTQLLTEVTWV